MLTKFSVMLDPQQLVKLEVLSKATDGLAETFPISFEEIFFQMFPFLGWFQSEMIVQSVLCIFKIERKLSKALKLLSAMEASKKGDL